MPGKKGGIPYGEASDIAGLYWLRGEGTPNDPKVFYFAGKLENFNAAGPNANIPIPGGDFTTVKFKKVAFYYEGAAAGVSITPVVYLATPAAMATNSALPLCNTFITTNAEDYYVGDAIDLEVYYPGSAPGNVPVRWELYSEGGSIIFEFQCAGYGATDDLSYYLLFEVIDRQVF
jgi:hypothetical protein